MMLHRASRGVLSAELQQSLSRELCTWRPWLLLLALLLRRGWLLTLSVWPCRCLRRCLRFSCRLRCRLRRCPVPACMGSASIESKCVGKPYVVTMGITQALMLSHML